MGIKGYKSVTYSRKQNGFFEVTVDESKYFFFANNWDEFLDKYGTNPKPKYGHKRLSGTDTVDERAFNKFIQLDQRHSLYE